MKQVNFDEIIRKAEARRAGIQKVVDMYHGVNSTLGALQQVRLFCVHLGTAYRDLDQEGQNLVCAALASGTRLGTSAVHTALSDLFHGKALTVSEAEARLTVISEAVNTEGVSQ